MFDKARLGRTLLTIIFLASTAVSQVATGMPPLNSFAGGPFDIVNLGNLNVHLSVPLLHKAGRGIPFTYDLNYDTAIWSPATVDGVTTWTPAPNWGWKGVTEVTTGYISYTITEGSDGMGCDTFTYALTYHDPLGVPHGFLPTVTSHLGGGNCIHTTFPITLHSTDGSGYFFTMTSFGPAGTLLAPSGKIIAAPIGSGAGAGTATDANGNQVTVNNSGQFFDTLSATSPVLTVAGTAPAATTYTYTGPSGSEHYTMNYASYSIHTAFGCSGVGEYTHTAYLVSSIVLPDTSKYSFTYEATTGRLLTVTLPTGGVITYTYTGANNGIVCTDGSVHGITRTLNPGGLWKYDRALVSGNHWTTTVTSPPDPQNSGSATDITVLDFEKDSNTSNPPLSYFETQRVVKQGTSTVLSTTITCYDVVGTPTPSTCPTATVASPFTRRTVFQYLPTSSGAQAETDTQYYNVPASNLYTELPTDVYDYDFGSAAVGPLLRHTQSSYAALGNGIIDHPAWVKVFDTGGTLKAQTTYTYDGTAVTATSGTPQHVSITGSRGNLTTASSLTTGSSTLSKNFTYYDTGTINTAKDVNAALTTYIYGSGTSCGNSFPTEIDLPLTLTTHSTWNCTGGVMATSTDLNSKVTTYEFTDSDFWRLTKVDRPNGGSTTYTYNTVTPPFDTATSSKQTSSVNVTTDTVLDGFGRVIQTQQTSDPAGDDFVDTVYDALGRVASVSNPHRSTSSPTDGTTQYGFDAMGRPLQVTFPDGGFVKTVYYHNTLNWYGEGNATAKFMQVDGLGRLTSVCERALSGTGALANGDSPMATGCNPDYPSYPAFQTLYSYDALGDITSVQQGQNRPGVHGYQTRTYQYDDLSRLTKEINPETGEIDYAYDTLHGGDLYRRTGPEPNHTDGATSYASYTFDLLHRITSIGYSDPYTPSLFFYWDTQSWWNGVTPNYPKGRLARQNSSTCGTNCAGDEYDYDIDGNIVGKASWTPSNIGSGVASYYGYNLLDQQISMTDIRGTTYTTAYDAASRPTSLSSTLSDTTHPPTLYTVNSYNPLGEITSATYGKTGTGTTATAHTATFDNRGRLLTIYDAVTTGLPYSLTVAYANGRVASANDSINGNWSSFQYDEYGRLKSSTCTANCPGSGNSLAYTYDYDEYGNRWHQTATAGTGYSPSLQFDNNNRLTPTNCTSGAGNYCYDGPGNLFYDGLGGAWSHDSEGRVFAYSSSSNSATYTSDALGQRTHRVVNGTVYDYVFDNQGRENIKDNGGFSAWNWSNLYFGGSHVATYASSSTYFTHSDHLESERMETDPTGNTNSSAETHQPFGEWTSTGMQNEVGFTGDLLDNPDGNASHTPNRQYSQTQGRWMRPDPAGLAAVDPANPQTWNRYAYVGNNPTSFTDPTGMNKQGPGSGGCDSNEYDCTGGGGGVTAGDGGSFLGGGNDANGFGWNSGPGSFGGPGNPDGLPSGVNGILLGELSYLQNIAPKLYGANSSVALGPNGFTISFYLNYWAGCSSDAPPGCIGRDVINLFQSVDPATNNGMFFAGVLPPGMDGALQAAKQATKGLPKTTPGPNLSPGKWRPPQSIEDLLNDASKAIKYVLDNIDFPGSGDFLFLIDPCLTSPNLRCGPYAPPQS